MVNQRVHGHYHDGCDSVPFGGASELDGGVGESVLGHRWRAVFR